MHILVIIGIVIIMVILIIMIIKYLSYKNLILNTFKKHNVIVFGEKGSGKDLLFQYVINKVENKRIYYGNLSYGGLCENIKPLELSIGDNTFNNLIHDKIKPIPHIFYEDSNVYISDGGIYFPSQMDSTLHKIYPSLPPFYALSRQLYNMNIQVNVQNLERLWKALREQADNYIWVKNTFHIGPIFFIKTNFYNKYQSALNRLEIPKNRFLNKFSKSNIDIYNASNGIIKTGYLILFKNNIKYDTRAFEKKILIGDRIYQPDKKSLKKRNKKELNVVGKN